MESTDSKVERSSAFEPLRHPVFRRMWLASLLSNFGLLIQGVGAAWAMTEMSSGASMIALVQTAGMLPMMLFALSAGAVADTYDRRLVGLAALVLSLIGAAGLTISSWLGVLSPWLILVFTFVIGSGIALFSPAWQASVSEQVPPSSMPSAISLTSISFNIARSFGPAIGGLIVAAGGATAAFLVNALFFLPMIAVLALWRRVQEPPRLPPERLNRAVVSGVRYVVHSPAMRVIIVRTILTASLGAIVLALMPLIVRDQLLGTAETYGLMLGAFGVGAVFGAFGVARLRKRLGPENTVRLCTLASAIAMLVMALSHVAWLTGAALIVSGACWMIAVTIYNIGIQTMTPRWVAGRALAAFQTSLAAGVAFGSWAWGMFAQSFGGDTALLVAAAATIVSLAAALWLRLPQARDMVQESDDMMDDPDVEMSLSARSGPIVIEIEYRVPRHRARAFYGVMQEVQLSRQRNGAYGWSIARDVSDPELWTERYHCPTWLDYLRQRNRPTQSEREIHNRAFEFHEGTEPLRIRRMLERPFGSVRWREDVRDTATRAVLPVH